MLGTLLKLALVTHSSWATAHDFTLKKRFDFNWNRSGWTVFKHHTLPKPDQLLLVAINRNTLDVEVLDGKKGRSINEDSLDSKVRSPRLLEALSTRTGEFLIALAKGDTREVELHTLDGNDSWQIQADAPPIGLTLLEPTKGEVTLLVATKKGTEIYMRSSPGEDPVLVKRIPSASPLLQMQAVQGQPSQIWVQTFSEDHMARTSQVDLSRNEVQTRLALNLPSVNKVAGRVSTSGDIMLAETSDRGLRFYNSSTQTHSDTFVANPNLGSPTWVIGTESENRPLFAILDNDKEGARLTLHSPSNNTTVTELHPKEAKAIGQVGQLVYKNINLVYFVKNQKTLEIVDTNDQAKILRVQARANERIVNVSEGDGSTLIISFEGGEGTHLVVADFINSRAQRSSSHHLASNPK